jgi:hypothetical protein
MKIWKYGFVGHFLTYLPFYSQLHMRFYRLRKRLTN